MALSINAFAQDKWLATDKYEHFGVGTVVGGITTVVGSSNNWSHPELIGMGAGCGIGAAKEIWDSHHPATHTASWKDFAATCLGGAFGAFGMGWVLKQSNGTTTLQMQGTF